jgi:hypothetical protein
MMSMSIKIVFLDLSHELTNLITGVSSPATEGWGEAAVHHRFLIFSDLLDLIDPKPIIRFCRFGENSLPHCVDCVTDWWLARVGKWGTLK